MKINYKNAHGFTLIEMIIVIMLIGMFTLGVTSVDFSRLSARQEHEIFVNDIITKIETLRNYAFQGKGIGTNLDTPDEWRLDISMSGSGTFLTTYSGSISGTYPPTSFLVQSGYDISDLRCTNLDESVVENISGTGSIFFTNTTMTISGCSDASLKVLELTTGHKGYSSTIEINSINGIIQQK